MSNFGVGDRVVVVDVTDTMAELICRRGVVKSILDSDVHEFNIEVDLEGWDGALFKAEELELEGVYDALSAKPNADVIHEMTEEEKAEWEAKAFPVALKVDSRLVEGFVKSFGDDVINSPSHYADGWSNGAEVIDITEHLNFNRGNAVKYLCRAGKKGGSEKELEDLQKAFWYIRREVLRLGGTV